MVPPPAVISLSPGSVALPRGMEREYDFHSAYLDLGGIRCHYLDEGSGKVVVMLHGNPTWSFMYRHLARALAPSHRVLVPDHVGCGLSDKPPDRLYSYRLARRVEDLERLLDHLGIDRFSLVAHDWGGVIGMTYATRHPRRIRKIVLFNTAAFLLPRGKRLHWSLRFCRRSRLAAFLILRFNLFARVAMRAGVKAKLPRQVRRAYLAPYDSWGHRLATLRFVQDIPLEADHPTYPLLAATDSALERLRGIPLRIFWGERDFIFDLDFLEEWKRRFPEAEVFRFHQAGHYVLEDESSRIVPLVRQFLEAGESG